MSYNCVLYENQIRIRVRSSGTCEAKTYALYISLSINLQRKLLNESSVDNNPMNVNLLF